MNCGTDPSARSAATWPERSTAGARLPGPPVLAAQSQSLLAPEDSQTLSAPMPTRRAGRGKMTPAPFVPPPAQQPAPPPEAPRTPLQAGQDYRPIIGILTDRKPSNFEKTDDDGAITTGACFDGDSYRTGVERFGGRVRWIYQDGTPLREQLARCDGILIPGGRDFHPETYNQTPRDGVKLNLGSRSFDDFEMQAAWEAFHAGIPIRGICRGQQALNVTFGGTLIQDIDQKNVQHSGGRHQVKLDKNSRLSALLGHKEETKVNSNHHQAIDAVAPGFSVVARSSDGIIEAIEREGRPDVMGVQFHPERAPDEIRRPFFRSFIEDAAHYREKQDGLAEGSLKLAEVPKDERKGWESASGGMFGGGSYSPANPIPMWKVMTGLGLFAAGAIALGVMANRPAAGTNTYGLVPAMQQSVSASHATPKAGDTVHQSVDMWPPGTDFSDNAIAGWQTGTYAKHGTAVGATSAIKLAMSTFGGKLFHGYTQEQTITYRESSPLSSPYGGGYGVTGNYHPDLEPFHNPKTDTYEVVLQDGTKVDLTQDELATAGKQLNLTGSASSSKSFAVLVYGVAVKQTQQSGETFAQAGQRLLAMKPDQQTVTTLQALGLGNRMQVIGLSPVEPTTSRVHYGGSGKGGYYSVNTYTPPPELAGATAAVVWPAQGDPVYVHSSNVVSFDGTSETTQTRLVSDTSTGYASSFDFTDGLGHPMIAGVILK